jgi:multicomponent Na+:H+ antiporter subunit C
MSSSLLYSLCFVLLAIGIYSVFVKKNVVKIVLGLMIMEYAVNLLLVLIGYRTNAGAPVMERGADVAQFAANSVDPMPQAIVISSIVIGLGLLILMVALCIRLYERYGTFDITEMRRLKG